jgi:mono/diheme cytochrome c family protein
VLVLAVLALAAGCGGGDDASSETTTETTAVTTTTTDGEVTTGQEEPGDATAGETVFASAGCGSCHTLAAAGTSGSVGPNLDDASPSYDKVVERVTEGQGAMPSFADQLSPQEIRDVAAYVSGSVEG